jgi:hypothetical protein
MSGSETLIALIIEIVCGATGGIAVSRWTGGAGLGVKADAVIGAVGGLVLTLLAGQLPGVARFVGHVEGAADATARGVGVLTPTVLVGVGVAGLLGGLVLTALTGFIRSAIPR